MGELAAGLVQLGRALEREADLPRSHTAGLDRQQAAPPGSVEKLAMGQKLSHDTDQQQTM